MGAGLGLYRHTGDWTWEFYTPPYDFLAPADSAPQPAPVIGPGGQGLAGCGCGGSCGCGGGRGVGAIDWGLSSPSIVQALSPSLPPIPNWAVYAAAAGLAFGVFSGGRRR